jgi:hypothetical protein
MTFFQKGLGEKNSVELSKAYTVHVFGIRILQAWKEFHHSFGGDDRDQT